MAIVESHLLYKWTMLIVPNLSLNHWLVTGGSKVWIYGTFTRVTAVRLLTLVTMGCAVTPSHYPPMQYYAIMYPIMALCDDMMTMMQVFVISYCSPFLLVDYGIHPWKVYLVVITPHICIIFGLWSGPIHCPAQEMLLSCVR